MIEASYSNIVIAYAVFLAGWLMSVAYADAHSRHGVHPICGIGSFFFIAAFIALVVVGVL